MAGLLGMGQQGGMGGILGGAQQQPEWANNLGLFSSALKDASAAFSGREDPGALAAWQQHSQAQQARQAILQAGNDPAALKQALANYALMGGNVAPIMSAMTFDQPKIESYGEGQNVFQVDPLTGARTQIQTGKEKPPSGYKGNPDGSFAAIPGGPADPSNPINSKPPAGYQYDPLHKRLNLIPGFLGASGELAAARRAPPKANANAPINLPHPGSMY